MVAGIHTGIFVLLILRERLNHVLLCKDITMEHVMRENPLRIGIEVVIIIRILAIKGITLVEIGKLLLMSKNSVMHCGPAIILILHALIWGRITPIRIANGI
jgi:hypothetical protein